MTRTVVDASLLSAYLFPGQFDSGVRSIVEGADRELFAPHLLRHEIANGALQLERRSALDATDSDAALAALNDLRIRFVTEPGWTERAFRVARRFRQRAIYDAIYLACAEDLDAELWTRDRRFVASFGGARPALLRLYPDDLPV